MRNENKEISELYLLYLRLSDENKKPIVEKAKAFLEEQRKEEGKRAAEETGRKT